MGRPLNEQVMVITGASSGIGRLTAVLAAKHGARVVMASRNQRAMNEIAAGIRGSGRECAVVPTDVAEWEQVRNLAERAVETFGGIDTWVNNAGVIEYSRFEEMAVEEIDRLIRVNLMGQVHGCKAALPHLRNRGGGTIVNVGSMVSKRAMPLLSAYGAAKAGVKALTDALRMELEAEGAPIDVTLILPASINTPLFNHARSRVGVKPRPAPPVYQPELVADAILFASEHARREIMVGGAGRMMDVAERMMPELLDYYMVQDGRMFRQQETGEPVSEGDNLFAPVEETGRIHGDFDDEARSSCRYTTTMEYYPGLKRAGVLALAAGAAVALMSAGRATGRRRDHDGHVERWRSATAARYARPPMPAD